jgi:outer membrane immunogenic protein
MKKLLLASTTALMLMSSAGWAADIYAAPDNPLPFTWSGLYVGVQGGYAFGDQANYQVEDYPELKADHDLQGWVFGGNVGARYQMTPMFVLGAEVTGLFADINGNKDFDLGHDFKLQTQTNIDALVLAEANVGMNFDRFLVFASGGYAGANVDPSVKLQNPGQGNCGGFCFDSHDTQWLNGWTVGAGAKYAITDSMIIGAKYNHIVFEDNQFDFNIWNSNVPVNGDVTIDQVVGTLELKF